MEEIPNEKKENKTGLDFNNIYVIGSFSIGGLLLLFISLYIAWHCWLKDHIEEMILEWLCCGYGEQFMTFMEIFGFFENWKEREEDRKLEPYTYGLKPHEQEIVKEIIKTNKAILQEAIKLKWKKLAKKAIRPKHMDKHIENYTQKKHTIIEMNDVPTKTDTPPGTPRRRRRTFQI